MMDHSHRERMTLSIDVRGIEHVYDELDTNAITFLTDDGYFSVQTCVYLEENDALNEPHLELNGQGDSQSGGVKEIVFFETHIVITFLDSEKFLTRYSAIQLHLGPHVQMKQLTDFFANYLFLGAHISYDASLNNANASAQTQSREFL